MAVEIKKGLDLPIAGKPVQAISDGPRITEVAIVGDDFIGMKPQLLVKEGDTVKLGQPVFEDKKTAGVTFVAPASGRVKSINRGAKRKFLSMIFEIDGDAEETFKAHDSVEGLEREAVEQQLLAAGMWQAFRTRPFSKVPLPGSEPNSIFVTAMDTNPLSAEPELIIGKYNDEFVAGLHVVTKLTSGKTYVCTRNDSRTPGDNIPNVITEEFHGPHPAGLPGTHIHFLDPVNPKKTVWQIGYQDVIAIGHLFKTGRIMTDRIVSVAGPRITKPGLYTTRLGCSIDELTAGMVDGTDTRLVSGSVLCGRTVETPVNFLGRYDVQVTGLEEGDKREFLGWQGPGFNKFSITRIYAGALAGSKLFNMSTNINGSKRSMVPVETYERVVPLDVLPTQLLRSLIVKDTDQAQALGCLELAEEDLALCTYVCPGKYEFGSILRENLTQIEKEG